MELRAIEGLASRGELFEAFRRSERLRLSAERELANDEKALRIFYLRLGKFYQDAALLDQSEAILQRLVALDARLFGPASTEYAQTVGRLAENYILQGRVSDAQAITANLKAIDRGQRRDPSTEQEILFSEVTTQYFSKNYEAAIEKIKQLLDKTYKPDLPPTQLSLTLKFLLSDCNFHLGRFAESERILRGVLDENAKAPHYLPEELFEFSFALARVREARGFSDEAAQMYRAIDFQTFGEGRPDFEQRSLVALEALVQNRLAAGDQSAFELSSYLVSKVAKVPNALRKINAKGMGHGYTIAYDAQFLRARAIRARRGPHALEDAFEALQRASSSGAGNALGRSARLQTLEGPRKTLFLEREKLEAMLADAAKTFDAAVARGASPAELQRLDAEKAELNAKLVTLRQELKTEFLTTSDYFRGDPVALAALRQGAKTPVFEEFASSKPLLKSDEALIMLVPGDAQFIEGQRRGFAFAVTREGAAWVELPLEPDALLNLAREVRDGSAIVTPGETLPPPRRQAKALYDALFGAPEIDKLISGKKNWIISPQGALLSIPFAALVTRAPEGEDDDPDAWANTAWLGTERALAILPEVHMLRSLRALDRPKRSGRSPYFGVAAPAFRGGATAETIEAAAYYKGVTGSPEAILQLSPLPYAQEEAGEVALALGARRDQLLSGEDATEANLRAKAALLGSARIVHFATHALISGEMNGLSQPALALMPPVGGGEPLETNDGLLTAAEAAALKLNADWVVLSGCNTAAGSTQGAEGLSGLARSFFFAGADSLLVSQWPVRDDSGALIVAETVKASAGGKVSRAEALRRAMIKVIASKDEGGASRAHPQDWAPFMLVGVDR